MDSHRSAKKVEVDVVIVGGGPAGSAAAIACAQNGLKVRVIEAVPFPRDHPGETLHPGIQVLWEQLGVFDAVCRAGFLRPAGHYLDLEQEIKFVPYGKDQKAQWLGFHAWRAKLDQILMDTAKQQGVEWWQECRAREVVVAQDRVMGVESDRGAVLSNFVMDSSGSAQWLPRRIGLAVHRHSERMVVKYGYRSCQPSTWCNPRFLMRHNGWGWIAEVRPGLAAWAALTVPDSSADDILSSFFNQTTALGPERGADACWRIVPECAGPGYFVLGDSAVSLDPACSHGVIRAISSGIMAAHQIVQVTRGTISQMQGSSFYRNWLSKWFQRDEIALWQQYQLHCPALAERIQGFVH